MMPKDLLKIIGNIDDSLVEEAGKYCNQELDRRIKFVNISKFAISVAACMIIAIGAGIFWIYNYQVIECSSKEIVISVDGKDAVYQYVSITRGEHNKLSKLKGDIVSTDSIITYYKLKGGLALQYLIMEQSDKYYKLRFLEYYDMYSYSDVLHNIYGVNGISDIEQVVIGKDKFSKENNIPTVIITDDLSKEKILNILTGIKSIDPDSLESNEDFKAKYNDDISRLISIKLVDGSVLQYVYGPYILHIQAYAQNYTWSNISVDDNRWIMKQAGIK